MSHLYEQYLSLIKHDTSERHSQQANSNQMLLLPQQDHNRSKFAEPSENPQESHSVEQDNTRLPENVATLSEVITIKQEENAQALNTNEIYIYKLKMAKENYLWEKALQNKEAPIDEERNEETSETDSCMQSMDFSK